MRFKIKTYDVNDRQIGEVEVDAFNEFDAHRQARRYCKLRGPRGWMKWDIEPAEDVCDECGQLYRGDR